MDSVSVLEALTGCRFLRARRLLRSPAHMNSKMWRGEDWTRHECCAAQVKGYPTHEPANPGCSGRCRVDCTQQSTRGHWKKRSALSRHVRSPVPAVMKAVCSSSSVTSSTMSSTPSYTSVAARRAAASACRVASHGPASNSTYSTLDKRCHRQSTPDLPCIPHANTSLLALHTSWAVSTTPA